VSVAALAAASVAARASATAASWLATLDRSSSIVRSAEDPACSALDAVDWRSASCLVTAARLDSTCRGVGSDRVEMSSCEGNREEH